MRPRETKGRSILGASSCSWSSASVGRGVCALGGRGRRRVRCAPGAEARDALPGRVGHLDEAHSAGGVAGVAADRGQAKALVEERRVARLRGLLQRRQLVVEEPGEHRLGDVVVAGAGQQRSRHVHVEEFGDLADLVGRELPTPGPLGAPRELEAVGRLQHHGSDPRRWRAGRGVFVGRRLRRRGALGAARERRQQREEREPSRHEGEDRRTRGGE